MKGLIREHKIQSWGLGLLFALLWLGGLGACGGTKAPPTATAVSMATPAQRTAEAERHTIAYQACTHWVTAESVGAVAFEEYGLADALDQGEFDCLEVGQDPWDRYGLAARLKNDSLVSICTSSRLDCLISHWVDGVEVSGVRRDHDTPGQRLPRTSIGPGISRRCASGRGDSPVRDAG